MSKNIKQDAIFSISDEIAVIHCSNAINLMLYQQVIFNFLKKIAVVVDSREKSKHCLIFTESVLAHGGFILLGDKS